MSPHTIQRTDALWWALSEAMPTIEAVTFHEATAELPPAWGIAFEGATFLQVEGQSDPDRLVFSLTLGEVQPALQQETCETVSRVNAWLAMQDDVVGGLALAGQHVVMSGQLLLDGLDMKVLRQAVLDIQGIAHAWRYFLQTHDAAAEEGMADRWLERV